MVKILANGEIVQDNDPRTQKPTRQRGIHQQVQQPQNEIPQGQQVSIFDTLNTKLVDVGLPNINLGAHVIQPIVYVGFILAFFLLGVKGLIFGLFLFVICKMSSGSGGFGQVLTSFFGGNPQRQTRQGRGNGNRLGGRVAGLR